MAEDAVLEIPKKIHASTTSLSQRMDVVTSTLQVQGGVLIVLQQDVRMIRSAVNTWSIRGCRPGRLGRYTPI
jgi:hypothetical protein